MVLITGLGESGIEMELGVFINDPEDGTMALRTDLYEAILQGFKAAGIAIPYQQRDVRLQQDSQIA